MARTESLHRCARATAVLALVIQVMVKVAYHVPAAAATRTQTTTSQPWQQFSSCDLERFPTSLAFELHKDSVKTRWLYSVECPQYSIRLEALGCLCDCVSGRVQKVVKVICHKAHRRRRRMVQCYSTGASNVSSHEGTLAPPGEYN